MLQIPSLGEMIRVTDNANKLAAAGFSFNEIQDLKKQEVLQQINSANAMGNGPQFGGQTGFTTEPRRYAEGGTINIAPNGRLLMKRSQPGVVPPEIAAANPGAYWSPKRQSVVIGDPKRNTEKAVGGFTWSGPAIKDGQFFANTGATTFGMPGPGKRRGTIGGRATPPAPDMFGRQFMKPTGPAPEGTTTSGGVSRAPMPWELPGYSDGGTIIGPGGPKDDMIPAMVDGMEPIAVSNGEEIVDAETRDYFGRKFFLDLKKKAEKGMEEANHHTEEGHGGKPGFAMGGTIPAPTLAAMTESAANARLDRGLSPDPYGPTMNDHPAFHPVSAAPPIAPAPSAMITPALEPQPMTAQFAPRTLGEPAAPPRPSNVPFLAPWEKDAARAAASDAASGRPAGVRKSDWRKFQRSPQGMMLAMQRDDRAAENQVALQREDERNRVRDQQNLAELNLRIAQFQQHGDAIKQAAASGNQQAQQWLAEFELRQRKYNEEQKRLNQPPEITTVPIPGAPYVVPYDRNRAIGGPLPAMQQQPDGIEMKQIPGSNSFIPVMDGKRVPDMPLFEGQTQHGPFIEGMKRQTFKPMGGTAGAKSAPKTGTIDEQYTDDRGVTATRRVPVVFNPDGTYTRMTETGAKQEKGIKPGSRFFKMLGS